jgi:hypothetical protein
MPDEEQYTGLPLHYLFDAIPVGNDELRLHRPLWTLKLDGILV